MKTALRVLAGSAAVGMVGLWMGQGMVLPAAEPGSTPESSITAGSGQLATVLVKLPRPIVIGTLKDLPPTVKQLGDKLRPPFKAPPGTTNLALNCPVTSSEKVPVIGELRQITDGDKEGVEGSWVEVGPGVQWVRVDLGKLADIYGVCLWHHHGFQRIYKAVVVQVSDDPDFINNVKTVFNNDRSNTAGLGAGMDQEYVENYQGELMPIKAGVQGRYVRFYSKGSTDDDMNHYIEVEVYGIAK